MSSYRIVDGPRGGRARATVANRLILAEHPLGPSIAAVMVVVGSVVGIAYDPRLVPAERLPAVRCWADRATRSGHRFALLPATGVWVLACGRAGR